MTWIDRIFYPSKKRPHCEYVREYRHQRYSLIRSWDGSQFKWQWRIDGNEPTGPEFFSQEQASWSFMDWETRP